MYTLHAEVYAGNCIVYVNVCICICTEHSRAVFLKDRGSYTETTLWPLVKPLQDPWPSDFEGILTIEKAGA